MSLRGLFWVLFLIGYSGVASGQRAEEIKISGETRKILDVDRCPDDAGTITPVEFEGQSNTAVNIPGPIYLCFNDQFYVRHDGNQNHCDPNPTGITAPGIGYAFYEGFPSVAGPSVIAVAGDPNLERNPPTTLGPWHYYRDRPNGDARFWNDGTIQDQFNGGAPEQMWFAPFTMDDFAAGEVSEDGQNGEVNVGIGEAFSVIYLNEIQISNKQVGINGNPLAASFTVSGGLPEWDPAETYTEIIIRNLQSPNDPGIVQTGSIGHDGVVEITVPQIGEYLIIVEDGRSCGGTMVIDFNGEKDELIIDTEDVSGRPGDVVCVSYCVENFDLLSIMAFSVFYDPNIVEFDAFQNLNLDFLTDGSFTLNDTDLGIIKVLWQDPFANGVSVADGTCIFDICFRILDDARPGTCSQNSLTESQFTVEVIKEDPVLGSQELDLVHETSEICVLPSSDFAVFYNTCGAATGEFSGQLEFEIYGGAAPYSFNITTPAGPVSGSGITQGEITSIGNLNSGNYVLTINDNAGGVINELITISNSILEVNLVGNDPTCLGFFDGSVSATVSGGEGPYIYEWSTEVYNIAEITGIPTGSYFVTVTDAAGCSVVANEYIGADPIIVDYNVISNPTCASSDDGMVEVIASGGNPISGDSYTYEWEFPNNLLDIGPTSTNNVTSGLVKIIVTDGDGCPSVEVFEIEPQTDATARFEFDQNILCAGDNEAIFRIYGEFEDGSGFDLNGGGSVDVEPMGTGLQGPDHVFFNGVGEGTYSVTLTDGVTGCTVDTTFTLEEPEILAVNGFAEYSCTSGNGGEIGLSVQGGVGPFTYLWADGSTDENRTNLDEGQYAVTVTDNNGCQAEYDTELMAPASARIDAFIVENIGCEGNLTGSIEPVITNAIGDVQYSWTGPGGPYTSDRLDNLGPGTYYLTVTDNSNCISADSVILVEGIDFTYNVTSVPPSCTYTPDGTLTIAVDDPGDYQYTWSHPNDNGSEVLTNIPAGDYFVTITQVGGCTQFDTITLESPASIDIQVTDSSPTNCSYSTDGSATVIAAGGVVNNGNYGFFWSSGEEDPLASNTTSTASMLSSGTQFVVVVDEMCFDTLFFEVEAPDSLMFDAANATLTDVSCFGLRDGSAEIAAMGGTPGYSYFWPDDNVNGAGITGLSSGFHRYVLADANGCLTIDSVLINQPDSLIAEVDPSRTQNIGCSNDADGIIAIQVEGGNEDQGYTYEWSAGGSDSEIAINLTPGTYTITVTDELGCIDSTTYTLTSPQPITADIPTPADPLCFGDRTCIGIDGVTGGSGVGYRFSINNGPLFSIDSCVSVFAGVYEISIFDNTGCAQDTTIIIEQPQELILDLGPDIQVDLGDSSTIIDVVIEGPNPILDINWEPISDFGCLNDDCSRIALFPNVTTLYKVSVMDELGCTAEDELLVEVVKIVRAFLPNAFSPNGDGFNDRFNVFTGRGILSVDELRVFDRWGNEMYGIMNLQPNSGGTEGWDGRVNDRDADPGVYTYFARVTLIDNEKVLLRGDVTLIR